MSTITKARRETSNALRGLELPDCFAAATVATEAIAIDRGRNARDARRAADKARKVDALNATARGR